MLISGRYQVLHPLQEGGFGHTFLAEDTQLPSRRRCVVKQLKPIHNDPQLYQLIQERFQREAAIQETLGEACPQIPRLYAYFAEENHFYLVEEWVDGETLRQKVAEVGRFSEAAVRELLQELLSVLEIVHQHQIIHRDIKPDNIILRKRDGKPVLIDFGAVKESMGTVVDSKGQTARSIVIGTEGYMSPEQSAGRPIYASDLYSLGLTAIFLLTGRSPAELYTDPQSGRIEWRSQVPGVSESLARVLDTAIQMQPFERFSSAPSMMQALTADAPNNLVYAPTVVSGSRNQTPESSSRPTKVVAPAAAMPANAHSVPVIKEGASEWIKAVLIGAGLGGVVLAGLFFFKGQSPIPVIQPSPLASSSAAPSPPESPTPTPTPIAASPSPTESVPPPSPEEPSPSPSSPAAASCGDPVGSGQTWYPVFIDNGDVNQVRQQHCQDAIAKTRDNGTPTVQVASFSDPQRAADFAQKVGGDVGQPYQVGTTPSPSASPSESPTPNAETNAVIVGNKGATNIRHGPGTNYGVQHIAYPGDRVKILDKSYDSGGYVWYKIYFPKSGASGWIAGQLLQPD